VRTGTTTLQKCTRETKSGKAEVKSALDELIQQGARQIIQRLASRLPFGQCECHGAGTRAAPAVERGQEAHSAAREGIAAQGKGAGGSGCAADSEKKSPGDLGRQRGRLINVPDRLLCVLLIREAAQSGCWLEKACDELGEPAHVPALGG
jgi:hypothetical protein